MVFKILVFKCFKLELDCKLLTIEKTANSLVGIGLVVDEILNVINI